MNDRELTRGGYSIFDETLADLTYPEVEALAREGAVILWGASASSRSMDLTCRWGRTCTCLTWLARRFLEARGIKAAILPPFYWGINNVTGSFAGSITVRPETMTRLMFDVFQSLRKDGFETQARLVADVIAAKVESGIP